MSNAALSAEYIGLLRMMQADLRRDVVAAASGLASLLRLLAAQIDDAKHEDLDMLVSAGIALAIIGEALFREALNARP
jgi:hypothetical protein